MSLLHTTRFHFETDSLGRICLNSGSAIVKPGDDVREIQSAIRRGILVNALSYEELCSLIDFLQQAIMVNPPARRGIPYLQALLTRVRVLKDNFTTQYNFHLAELRTQLKEDAINVLQAADGGQQFMINSNNENRCTENYRKCKNSVGNNRSLYHHCYWAVRRCAEDAKVGTGPTQYACAKISFGAMYLVAGATF